MTNTIIPGKPPRPIRVEVQAQPAVSVDASGRIPPGGTTGQSLVKASDGDFATAWGSPAAEATWGAITGTLSTQTDLQTALNGKQPLATVLTNTTAAFTTAQETKLAGIATGATANATDAALRDRATHTGTQLAATISDFASAVAATAAVTANTAKVTNATHTGDVTGATALTIAADAVTNAKLANMATATIKGRATAGTGDPEDLTGAQATALLDTFTSGAKGLVPASGGGTTNFLRADGTFAAPPGGGTPGGASGEVQFNNAGAFGGAADVEIEGGQLRLPAIAMPAAPAASGAKLYGITDELGRVAPAFLGPDGVQYQVKPDWAPGLFRAQHDFITLNSDANFTLAQSGTGAGFTSTGAGAGIGRARMSTGTTTTGRAVVMDQNGTASVAVDLGVGPARTRAWIRTGPDLSTLAETYIIRCGFLESNNADGTDAALFRYQYDINGGRWQAVTRSNSVETSTDTGITFAVNTVYRLEVRSDAAGNVRFYIDDVLVATNTTNIPTGGARTTGYGLHIVKSAGLTARVVDVEYFFVEQYLARV